MSSYPYKTKTQKPQHPGNAFRLPKPSLFSSVVVNTFPSMQDLNVSRPYLILQISL